MKFFTYYLLNSDSELLNNSENETGKYKVYKNNSDAKLNNYIILRLYKGKKASTIYIGFSINSQFKYTTNYCLKFVNFLEIAEYNIDFLMNLVYTSNVNAADIKKYIIDEFNNNNLILFTYSNNLKYNEVEEIAYLIFNINNELYKLGKTIKLYNVENTDDQGNVTLNDLKYVNLGEKRISKKIEKENESFHCSTKLHQLINTLIGEYIPIYKFIKEKYNIDIEAKNLSCEKCSTAKQWNNFCNECMLDKFKNLVYDIY